MSLSIIIYAFLAGVIPSLVWLMFWLREDVDHPEPRWLIAITFASGIIAVILAIIAEKSIADVVSDQTIRYTLWAGLEEMVKVVVVAAIVLNSKFNDEPIDAMIYMITIALGFSAIENVLFLLRPFETGTFLQAISTESMRFIGASLVHVVCSAIIGFSLGYTFYKSRITRAFSFIVGVIAAITLHSLFNLFIISASPADILKVFAWLWSSVVILLMLFEEIKVVRPSKLESISNIQNS